MIGHFEMVKQEKVCIVQLYMKGKTNVMRWGQLMNPGEEYKPVHHIILATFL